MTDNNNKINQLLEKLEALSKRQANFSNEIDNLRVEIYKLKIIEPERPAEKEEIDQAGAATNTVPEFKKENVTVTADYKNYQQQARQGLPKQAVLSGNKPPEVKSDLEKFIGENVINKIGIIITVIGVAIGAEYAIDHELISPLTRIVLGYLAGIGLLGFALKLKKKYENFSAVLLSGAMAIMYFITYSAYSFYDLIPQVFAFVLMVIFTAFTVLAAIKYNRQVIAHIGLVGAYAVPFLLSDGSGKVAILFSYMAIINTGILAIAFKKYWKPLYYASFGLTWFMYFIWYVLKYQTTEHFILALTFLFIFFAIFYTLFLAYKLFRKEKFEIEDIILLLANSFIFYAIGYAILDHHSGGGEWLGFFTLCNAVIHFISSLIIYRQKLADRNLLNLVSGLVLVFLTLAIPVQLDGSQVTLLWAGEAALLFWIGRTRNAPVYEKLSYPLMVLAFFSIVHDWTLLYGSFFSEQPAPVIIPLFNIHFLTALLFLCAFGFIIILSRNKKFTSVYVSQESLFATISLVIPAIFLFTLYYAFRLEIANYWNQRYIESTIIINSDSQQVYMNHDLRRFKTIWIINYSLFFISALSFVNLRKWKSQLFGLINLGLLILGLVVFLTEGLYTLSELRENYLEQALLPYFEGSIFNIVIRYISLAFVVLMLVVCYKYLRRDFMQKDFKRLYDFLLHTSVVWMASSELINQMELAGLTQSYKLGLSILWGVYSLFLIVLGIRGKKKHLRIGAISLFSITLIKLFFYDISHLDTISKTVVFVSLGVLLLIISFLYNKYKHSISDETDN